MALLAWVKGERTWARELWRSAHLLKRRFNRDFWMEDEGFSRRVPPCAGPVDLSARGAAGHGQTATADALRGAAR